MVSQVRPADYGNSVLLRLSYRHRIPAPLRAAKRSWRPPFYLARDEFATSSCSKSLNVGRSPSTLVRLLDMIC